MVAGGPATNAAVAFSQLGRSNQAILSSVLGEHPLAGLLREDLQGQGVIISPTYRQAGWDRPPVSSIVVSASSGDRAVISRSAEDMKVDTDKAFKRAIRRYRYRSGRWSSDGGEYSGSAVGESKENSGGGGCWKLEAGF